MHDQPDPSSEGFADRSGGAPPPFQRCDRAAAFPYTPAEYVRRFAWNAVRATFFRWSPNRLGTGWRAMLPRLFGAKVGAHCNVRSGCMVFHPWLLEMGDWSTLADDVVVYNLGRIRIGCQTVVSQGTYLCAGTHDYRVPELPLLRPPIDIGNGVWIAAQAFIGPGVTIGDGAVVGARSVVTKNVPAGMVVAGNPARVIKPRTVKAGSGGPQATGVDA